MAQESPPSDEALIAKREEFDRSRQELSSELDQVKQKLSNDDDYDDEIRKVIEDFNDPNSSKLDIKDSLKYQLIPRIENLQEAERIKLKITTYCDKLSQLDDQYCAAITSQSGRVRSLSTQTDKNYRDELEKAEKRLKALKDEFLSDIGREWCKYEEEGPILLTTNKVRGRDVLPEWKEMVKHLSRKNIIR